MSYSQLLGPKRIIDGCTRKDQHDIGYVFMNLIFTKKKRKKKTSVTRKKIELKREKKKKKKGGGDSKCWISTSYQIILIILYVIYIFVLCALKFWNYEILT